MANSVVLFFVVSLCSTAIALPAGGVQTSSGRTIFTPTISSAAQELKKVVVPSMKVDGSTATYYISNYVATWERAITECAAANLKFVAVENRDKNNEVRSALLASGIGDQYTYFFTSGKFDSVNDAMFWGLTGQNMRYSNWNDGDSPDFKTWPLLILDKTERNWVRIGSTASLYFICEQI